MSNIRVLLPYILGLLWTLPPHLANNLGDLRVRLAGMLGNDRSLIVLTEENEGYQRCC